MGRNSGARRQSSIGGSDWYAAQTASVMNSIKNRPRSLGWASFLDGLMRGYQEARERKRRLTLEEQRFGWEQQKHADEMALRKMQIEATLEGKMEAAKQKKEAAEAKTTEKMGKGLEDYQKMYTMTQNASPVFGAGLEPETGQYIEAAGPVSYRTGLSPEVFLSARYPNVPEGTRKEYLKENLPAFAPLPGALEREVDQQTKRTYAEAGQVRSDKRLENAEAMLGVALQGLALRQDANTRAKATFEERMPPEVRMQYQSLAAGWVGAMKEGNKRTADKFKSQMDILIAPYKEGAPLPTNPPPKTGLKRKVSLEDLE